MRNVIKLLGSMAAVVATALLLHGSFATPSDLRASNGYEATEPVGCFNVHCGPTTDCSAICGDAYACVGGLCRPQ
jgi:hypothetical protein